MKVKIASREIGNSTENKTSTQEPYRPYKDTKDYNIKNLRGVVGIAPPKTWNPDLYYTDPNVKSVGRARRQPIRHNTPEETRQNLVKTVSSKVIKGPIYLPKKYAPATSTKKERLKHIYSEERGLRDPVIAHTPEGKRVFGYNEKGTPICFSRLRGFEVEEGRERCHSVATMANGRCKRHGGRAVRGADHWNAQHLRCAASLPTSLQHDYMRAEKDPDLLSLDHELRLSDLRIVELERNLDIGVNYDAARKLHTLIKDLNSKLNTGKEISEDYLQDLCDLYLKHQSRERTWDILEKAKEERRRLAETSHRREKDLNQLLRADQAISLVTAVVSACKEAYTKTVARIFKRYRIIEKSTGKEVANFHESIFNNFKIDVASLVAKTYNNGARQDEIIYDDDDTVLDEEELKEERVKRGTPKGTRFTDDGEIIDVPSTDLVPISR